MIRRDKIRNGHIREGCVTSRIHRIFTGKTTGMAGPFAGTG